MNVPLFIPLAVTLIVTAIGYFGNRGKIYWARGLAAIVVAAAMVFLGAAGGTLDDPSRDGLITRWIRETTSDGAAVGIWAIGVLSIGYGAIIYFIASGVRKDTKARGKNTSAG